MKIFILSVAAVITCALPFICLNNIPSLPWSIIRVLWYGYIPLTAAAIAFNYGRTAKKSGGGIVIGAMILAPLLYLSKTCALPFASTFTALPSLLAAIPCAILGEISAKHK